MTQEEAQAVADSVSRKEEAAEVFVKGISEKITLLENLGLTKEDIARRLGLAAAKPGRPKGSRPKKSAAPDAK